MAPERRSWHLNAGIALFGVITEPIAAYFVEYESEDDNVDVAARLDEISRAFRRSRTDCRNDPAPPCVASSNAKP